MLTLSTQPREKGKQLGGLRKSGYIPAVLYGHGFKSRAVSLPKSEFTKVLKEAGESTLIELKGENKQTVLIRDVQMHPVSEEIVHVDLYAVRMDEKIKVPVPLVFTGESPAAVRGEGVLVKNIHEVEAESLPGILPHELPIDLSLLDAVDAAIRIKDIPVPEGVSIIADNDEIVAIVAPAMSEEELAALETPPEEKVEEVEVAGEKKEGEEEEEKEEPQAPHDVSA